MSAFQIQELLPSVLERKAYGRTAGLPKTQTELWDCTQGDALLVAEAPWSVAEWAVAPRFDHPRATVLVLLLG